jgi:hypothetical protein
MFSLSSMIFCESLREIFSISTVIEEVSSLESSERAFIANLSLRSKSLLSFWSNLRFSSLEL